MKHLLFSVVLSILGASILIDAQERKWTPMVCTNGVYMPAEEAMKQLPACSDPNLYGQGPDKLHPNCGFYCQVKALGLLGPDGHTSFQIYSDWVDASFPAEHKETVRSHFKDCFERYGNAIDHADPECKIADAFTKCTWDAVPKMVDLLMNTIGRPNYKDQNT